MYARVTGSVLIYIGAMALLSVACLHDLNSGARGALAFPTAPLVIGMDSPDTVR